MGNSGSGMNNPDHISENMQTILWVKNISTVFFHADPGSEKEKHRIRERKTFGSGIEKHSDPG
jgi:hypothetical protein